MFSVSSTAVTPNPACSSECRHGGGLDRCVAQLASGCDIAQIVTALAVETYAQSLRTCSRARMR